MCGEEEEHVMSKIKLAKVVAHGTSQSQRSAVKTIDAFLGYLAELLAIHKKVTLGGFGTFVIMKRKSRKGRNPRTGAELVIPAAPTVRFRASERLKQVIR